ncbi:MULTISPECIES: SspB family protein [Gluconobacter]|uniref:Stringent starvation protein B n=1 Tax=Gluconobacter cerinus TaxID=38307 RepID=A0A1B6VK99_9PROT|nr:MULTISPECIES: ClpXP protease specificity-enhancing factor SspB [Gluconobacter]OAJ67478.1 Stringent starvation protein B [Gluconobacter cerinus]
MSDDDHTGQDGLEHDLPESLLPYDDWVEDAYREVMLRAIEHVAAEGLPGAHHFYLTFRTNRPDVIIPSRLRAQYPEEMTIVLQHQFWDLALDREKNVISVGLSFGGVGSILVIPVAAITAFADPHIRMALRFVSSMVDDDEDIEIPEGAVEPDDIDPTHHPEVTIEEPPQEEKKDAEVVSLAAFRKRPPT